MPRYFAYGSNMSSAVITGRISSASDPVPAVLPGFRLAFSLPSQRWGGHAAGIDVSPGDEVWGVLRQIDDGDLDELDGFEAAYDRVQVAPLVGGDAVDAVSYVVKESRRDTSEGRPIAAYLDRMVTGATEHDLPHRWVESLRNVPTADGPEPVEP